MKKTLERRLDKVRNCFSAKELVLLQLEQGRKQGSLAAHAAVLAKLSAGDTLCNQVERAVRDAQKWQNPENLNRVIRKAQEEVLFLSHLMLACNSELEGATETNSLRSALSAALLDSLILRSERGMADAAHPRMWLESAEAGLVHLRAELLAADMVGRTYFDGKSVLYPETRERWEREISNQSQLIESFLPHFETEPTVDSDLLRRIRDAAAHKANWWVDYAKAMTMDRMGQTEGARELMKKRLTSG